MKKICSKLSLTVGSVALVDTARSTAGVITSASGCESGLR